MHLSNYQIFKDLELKNDLKVSKYKAIKLVFNDHNVVSQANKSQALPTTRIHVVNISVEYNVLCKMYR